MSSDAYSPVTGRWGVTAYWDLYFGGLALVLFGLLVLVLAVARRQRAIGALAVLSVVPMYFVLGWMNNVQVTEDGEAIDCLFSGPVDYGDRCGSEFLERYAMTAGPLGIALIGTLVVLALSIRERWARRSPSLHP